ncbi:G patch domain-containing protein 1-like isoform X2 [Littorina saxatilis]|uniref:G patch domain-containing protein 1-like isoform X2 n=1 Tax=Littorina saxatilis TaxID=31220 RepID=UPI0038B4A80A
MAASSDSDDEDFVELGKPLPFVEGEGKKRPISLQDASASSKESKGRPRFHGAFTGGFSAGYFNSVGSKEGWTPSTFVSSRQQRQGADSRRPEDFMDDEDLGEHGIAPRHVATSGVFSSEEQSRKRRADAVMSTRDSILPATGALTDLIVPDRLPVGIKLLRKMGWKEGQGLGPRVKKKRKKKKEQTGVKVYGCSLPSPPGQDSESEDSDIDLNNITFAPKDVTPISLTSKDNVHGLGYHGLDPRSALPGTHVNLFEPPAVRSSKGKKGIRGQAFGVGALEDEDADIYAGDAMSNYDQTMELDDTQHLFGWTAPGARTAKGKQAKPKVPVSYVGKLLEGFTLSDKPLPKKKVFHPPTLPSTFRSFHTFKKTAEQLAQEAVGEMPAALGQRPGQQKLNAVERGMMLDETPIAASVFDLIPKSDKQKLEAVKEAAKMAASRFQSAGTTVENNNVGMTDTTPAVIDPSPAPEANKAAGAGQKDVKQSADRPGLAPLFSGSVGVQPFRTDPAKQERFDRYLALVKQGVKEAYEEVAASHLTEWEQQREREEFTKAGKIYRPLANMMASRFTRGAFIDDADQPAGSLEVGAEKSEEAKAADMKMYGRLTREDMEWHPHNLLCKRFNVPNPYPESDMVGVPGLKRDKFSVFTFLSVPPTQTSEHQTSTKQDAHHAQETTSSLTRELNASKRRKGALSIFSVLEDDKAGVKPLPALTRAKLTDEKGNEKMQKEEDKEDMEEEEEDRPVDLFRAIFKNSDSESSSASDKSDDEQSDVGGGDADSAGEEKENHESPSQPLPVLVKSPVLQDQNQTSRQQASQQSTRENTSPSPLPPPAFLQPSSSTLTSMALARQRKRSRWTVGGSIFDVLDQSPHRSSSPPPEEERIGDVAERLSSPDGSEAARREEEEEEDIYGPALPPSVTSVSGGAASSTAADIYIDLTGGGHHKHKHKHREHHRDSSKHRHKKEKKKAKHKKEKKKKEKKKSKRSHSSRHKSESSGSEADSETDSDS